MKTVLSLFLVLATVAPASANKNPVQSCKVRFAFVYVDRLNNTDRGLQGNQLKNVQKKLSQYGDGAFAVAILMGYFKSSSSGQTYAPSPAKKCSQLFITFSSSSVFIK
jgi:hypothetical protein